MKSGWTNTKQNWTYFSYSMNMAPKTEFRTNIVQFSSAPFSLCLQVLHSRDPHPLHTYTHTNYKGVNIKTTVSMIFSFWDQKNKTKQIWRMCFDQFTFSNQLLERSPGEGNGYPLQYSCWDNSMDRGVWWATVHRVAKSQTRLSD